MRKLRLILRYSAAELSYFRQFYPRHDGYDQAPDRVLSLSRLCLLVIVAYAGQQSVDIEVSYQTVLGSSK